MRFVPFSQLTCDKRKNQRQTKQGEKERDAGKRDTAEESNVFQHMARHKAAWFEITPHTNGLATLQSFGVHTVLPLTMTDPALPKSTVRHGCIKLPFP